MSESLSVRLRREAIPFESSSSALQLLVERIGDARYVLLGEASHGTHEFYAFRAELTKALIAQRQFSIVAVEADWPDAYRVNRFVRGIGHDADARDALASFERFPRWLWRNQVVLDFVRWLRVHNAESTLKVGFYGIDLYSLHASIDAVLGYLEKTDPQLARDARARYGCFEGFGGDPQRYGFTTSFGYLPSCEAEVVAQLIALRAHSLKLLKGDGMAAEDELFFAEQNARVVESAERYYRAMYRGGIASWNLRDTHMADTIDALCGHFGARDKPAKVIVWAHNSHLGDARATELGEQGELNVGQLMRERHPGATFLLGFCTYEGSVTAASDWDAPWQVKRVRPGLPGSYEALFHALALPRFLLFPRRLEHELAQERLQRAIGVIYRPETERSSHYFHARLARQFDALVHVDCTRALQPLDRTSGSEVEELPETYPSGM